MIRIFPRFVGGAGALGLLILRVAVGAAFILHGWQKVQNATGWMPEGMPMPEIFKSPYMQAAAACSEFGGGILLILGLLTPLAALALAGTMAVALATVHLPAGQAFVGKPGEPSWELPAAYLASVLTLLLVGPGKLSVDALLFDRKPVTDSPERGDAS